MALPTGIVTRTLTVSPEVGNRRKSSLEVLVDPSVDVVVWTDTQEPISNHFRTIRTTPDQIAVVEFPAVDQLGFVDKDLNPITNWHYKVTVRYLIDGRKVGKTVVKYFKPLMSTPPVSDFDLIASGESPLYVGPPGPAGLSAYEVAVQNGFIGTEEEWLASLSSGGVRPYTTWDQTTPATEWVVVHNLGYNPGGVAVVNSANEKVWAPFRYVDNNTLIITMSAAMSGTVHLS